MRSAAKFQSEASRRPEEASGSVLCGVRRQQQLEALAEGFGVLRHFERRDGGFGEGTVFERGKVERKADFGAVRGAGFLVEALAGFVAEPAALN